MVYPNPSAQIYLSPVLDKRVCDGSERGDRSGRCPSTTKCCFRRTFISLLKILSGLHYLPLPSPALIIILFEFLSLSFLQCFLACPSFIWSCFCCFFFRYPACTLFCRQTMKYMYAVMAVMVKITGFFSTYLLSKIFRTIHSVKKRKKKSQNVTWRIWIILESRYNNVCCNLLNMLLYA